MLRVQHSHCAQSQRGQLAWGTGQQWPLDRGRARPRARIPSRQQSPTAGLLQRGPSNPRVRGAHQRKSGGVRAQAAILGSCTGASFLKTEDVLFHDVREVHNDEHGLPAKDARRSQTTAGGGGPTCV